MKTTGILLVGYSNIDSKIATEVARMAFPRAIVKTASTVEDAIASNPIADTDLLVLPRPSPAEVDKAMEVVDQDGLPRWAIVVVDSNPVPPGIEVIAHEEWAGPVTSHAFRSAISQHILRRDLARARGDLAAIGVKLAHDLRTQVASILATAELSKELLQEVEPSQTELYQPIFESVDSLGELIERMSFITKVSANGTLKSPCKMEEAVKGAISRLNREVAQKNASIIQPAAWPEVIASQPCLEIIWVNLIGNALNHAGENPRIELGWKKDKNEYRFWIRDYGDGVPPKNRERLFQPFHLLHRTNGHQGLGLPIVHRISELHGGRCGYELPTDGGAQFFFTLPV